MEEIEESTQEEVTPVEVTPVEMPEAAPKKDRTALKFVGIIAAILLVVGFLFLAGYGFFSLATQPSEEVVVVMSVMRDFSIIILALVTIVIGAFLAVLMFQLQSLTVLLRDEIKPILESANETASTVRGTTTFVSDAVVTPMISAASYVTAVRETVRAFAVGSRRKTRRQQRPEPDKNTE
jgi:acyl-CoA synthetase (AMP-forming)/AMP-acid ligase II